MDIEKVQRINALASELRKHHFAASSEDAYQQAEQALELPQQKGQEEEQHHSVAYPEALAEKRIELLLEMNNRKYAQELDLLRSAVNKLSNDVQTVMNEVRKISELTPPKKEAQQPLKTEEKVAHPRQGSFSSDDVDIQKMFYFGDK